MDEAAHGHDADEILSKRLQSLMEKVSNAFYILDKQWKFIYVNSAAAELLGKSSRELVGKEIWKTFPQDMKSILFLEFKQAAEQNRPTKFTTMYGDDDRWYDVNVYPAEDGLTVYFNDITERKRIDDHLYQRERQFRAIVENTPDMIARFDRELRYVYVNPATEKAFHIPQHSFIGKTRKQLHLEAGSFTQIDDILHQVFKSGEEATYNSDLNVKGETRYFQSRIVPEFDKQGNVEYVMAVSRDVTEQKEIEQALRISEERFTRLFESDIIGIALANFAGEILEANDAFLNMLGYTRAEFESEGLTWTKITPKEYSRKDQELIKQVKLTGTGTMEKEYCRKDGSRVSVLLGVMQLEQDGGDNICFILDLTERRKVEEERARLLISEQSARAKAEENETRYRFISETIPQLVWTADPSGGRDYYNQNWYNYTGFSPDQTLGWGWTEAVYSEDLQHLLDAWKISLKTGQIFHVEYRLRRYDGVYRWYLVRALPMRDDKGQIIKWFGSCTDIHDRRESEELQKFLAEAGNLLSGSLDYKVILKTLAYLAVPKFADWCTIDVLTDDGSIQQIEVAHIDPSKVAFTKELNQDYPVDMNAQTGMPNVIRTGKSEMISVLTDELLIQSAKDERQLEILRQLGLRSYICVPLTARGRTLGAITFISAESGRNYSEKDKEVVEDLARRAALAVDNAKLYLTAQSAIQTREDFLSIASHELKTPITSMKVFAQMLEKQFRKAGDEKSSLYISKLNQQINRLTNLIGDLLDLSKIQAGKLALRLEYFDINDLMKETIESVSSTDADHKIILHGEVNKPVFGDRDRIGQVIINLLSNAIKYSPEADKVIVQFKDERDHVLISVQDFGIGIDQENLDKVFGRFYQADDPKRKTFPGLGIGLYISYEIVHRHHGEIWAESEKGVGSTFYFTIPYENSGNVESIELTVK